MPLTDQGSYGGLTKVLLDRKTYYSKDNQEAEQIKELFLNEFKKTKIGKFLLDNEIEIITKITYDEIEDSIDYHYGGGISYFHHFSVDIYGLFYDELYLDFLLRF